MDASFSTGGGRSRTGMAMYLVNPIDGSESLVQWASRRQTQGVCTGTKKKWGIHPDNKVVGFQHGLEKSSKWDQEQTKVLFLTEGIVMRQSMKTPDFNSQYSVIDGCAVLMLDEVHSGSSDMELILARILPKLKTCDQF